LHELAGCGEAGARARGKRRDLGTIPVDDLHGERRGGKEREAAPEQARTRLDLGLEEKFGDRKVFLGCLLGVGGGPA
jgi:hypothetical protein